MVPRQGLAWRLCRKVRDSSWLPLHRTVKIDCNHLESNNSNVAALTFPSGWTILTAILIPICLTLYREASPIPVTPFQMLWVHRPPPSKLSPTPVWAAGWHGQSGSMVKCLAWAERRIRGLWARLGGRAGGREMREPNQDTPRQPVSAKPAHSQPEQVYSCLCTALNSWAAPSLLLVHKRQTATPPGQAAVNIWTVRMVRIYMLIYRLWPDLSPPFGNASVRQQRCQGLQP